MTKIHVNKARHAELLQMEEDRWRVEVISELGECKEFLQDTKELVQKLLKHIDDLAKLMEKLR